MRYYQLFILLFLSIILLGCSSTKKTESVEDKLEIDDKTPQEFVPISSNNRNNIEKTENELVYTNYGFTITLPKDWDVAEAKNDIASDVKLIVVSQFEDENDTYKENLAVGKKALKQEVPVELYASVNVETIENKTGIRYESLKPIVVNGVDAYQVVFPAREVNEIKIKQMQTYFVSGTDAFILIFSAEESRFYNYSAMVNRMISSFKIN